MGVRCDLKLGESLDFAPVLQQGFGHDGWRFCDRDACGTHGGDLAFCGAFAAGDDGSGVSHAASGRRGCTRDETCDGFLTVFANPLGGFFFVGSSDFANHDDGFGLRIFVKHLEDIEMRCSVDGIAADPNAGGLAESSGSQLEDGFVGEGS